MNDKRLSHFSLVLLSFLLLNVVYGTGDFSSEFQEAVERLDIKRDICVILGLPQGAELRTDLADMIAERELMVYFQSPDQDDVTRVRKAAEREGLLGFSVFVEEGDWDTVHLADNLAGLVLVSKPAQEQVHKRELKRVVYPGSKILLGNREISKPAPKNTDIWSHPYHGPDNNPQSLDQRARAPYLTQFLADPMFVPMPEISVAAGGKVFRAFGHIAHKANQNAWLNTLICVNAYNGRIIWQRALKEGFMIHRNTMIATPDTLFLADDESCKLFDTQTGAIKDSIVIPEGLADGPVWKWMALEDGVLYALIGGQETPIKTQPSRVKGLGHWPWGMWDGHDYKDPRTNFGFGRTFVAIDPTTKKILWNHRCEDYLDSRGVCMKNGKIYSYCPEKFLACLDTKQRRFVWKTTERNLLDAIGPNERAQHYVTGYATTPYIKCNNDYIFFAGPQRNKLVVASAHNGKLLWQKEGGNLQLVLREDGFYAAGPQGTGAKYAYATGKVLAQLPRRRACTRATGSVDSIFFRTPGGTVRVATDSNQGRHIAPMRPACQDGVIISNGQLYWGPWMCGCQLSLYGHISLAPAGDFDYHPPLDDTRLEPGPAYGRNKNQKLKIKNERNIHQKVQGTWQTNVTDTMPTAPVLAGDMVFVADRKGIVQAFDRQGQPAWKAYTGGAIYYAPAVAQGYVYVGSADGWVYALSAHTGQRAWRFRVGPAERRLPVYGKLISTWPVAGGVVVKDGVVYAAAGISHYDGTYIVALDAQTGKVRWYNDESGTLSDKAQSGVSLQGPLSIQGNELQFAGGGIYRSARYDLATGRCLNRPFDGLNSRFATAFYAYFPDYAKYEPLHQGYPDGKLLQYDVSYEGSKHDRLGLLGPVPKQKTPTRQTDRPSDRRRNAPKRPAIWQHPAGLRYQAFVVTPDTLLAAGVKEANESNSAFINAIKIEDGSIIWRQKLPAPAVKGGIAVNSQGRIVVTMEDGTMTCFMNTPVDAM